MAMADFIGFVVGPSHVASFGGGFCIDGGFHIVTGTTMMIVDVGWGTVAATKGRTRDDGGGVARPGTTTRARCQEVRCPLACRRTSVVFVSAALNEITAVVCSANRAGAAALSTLMRVIV